MASLIDELIITLSDEILQYKGLLVLADKKREVLIKGDIQGIVDTTKQEQRYAATMQKLEKRREKIIEDIALVTNQPKELLTISKLVILLKSQEAESLRLKELSVELVELLHSLKEKNDLNTQLTNQSLDYINFTFNAIKSAKEAPIGNNYQQKGRLSQPNGYNNYFDAKQ